MVRAEVGLRPNESHRAAGRMQGGWYIVATVPNHFERGMVAPFDVYSLYADPAYRYVMFGENDRSVDWVFSRTPTIADEDYQALMDRFAALGYDTTRFRKVIQLPEQIGMPGFWNDGIR